MNIKLNTNFMDNFERDFWKLTIFLLLITFIPMPPISLDIMNVNIQYITVPTPHIIIPLHSYSFYLSSVLYGILIYCFYIFCMVLLFQKQNGIFGKLFKKHCHYLVIIILFLTADIIFFNIFEKHIEIELLASFICFSTFYVISLHSINGDMVMADMTIAKDGQEELHTSEV